MIRLRFKKTDYWQVSWVINGETTSSSGQVGSMTLASLMRAGYANGTGDIESFAQLTGRKDKFGIEVTSPDDNYHAWVSARVDDVRVKTNNQLFGYTINILDSEGNVKKSANSKLEFKLFQRAENKTAQDGSLTFQIGSEANVAIKVALTDMRAHALGLKGNDGKRIQVTTKDNANAAINVFDNALEMALDQSTSIGAVQQRLEYTQTNLTTSSENVQAAESTIRDADMAKEMTEFTKNNVLMQAAQAMLAQANQSSSSVISLLQ